MQNQQAAAPTPTPEQLEQQRLQEAQVRMRAASGSVTSQDPLVAFLYVLLRDQVSPGKLEDLILNNVSQTPVETLYSNGWLANYCKDIAQRLRVAPSAPATAEAPAAVEPTPQFQIVFDALVWEKEGQQYLTPKVKVMVDGKQIGSLDRIAFEVSSKQALPVIEIDQKDFPPDRDVFRVQELQRRFPWMKITVLPWDAPAPAAQPQVVPEVTPPAPPEAAAATSDPGSA